MIVVTNEKAEKFNPTKTASKPSKKNKDESKEEK